MFLGNGIFALATLVLMAYCVFDVIRTDDSSVQNLPKLLWLLLVIFLPVIGGVAWLLLGRPARGSWRLDSAAPRQLPEPPAPTGHPEPPVNRSDHQAKREDALRRYEEERAEELKRREEELKKREEELRRREEKLGDA